MATNVVMPQMGESIAEGTIVRWIKKVGDAVDRDEPLFEISTDKVDAEIPSPAAGVLTDIRVKEGETVPVNSVVAVIGADGEKPSAEPAQSASAPAAASAAVEKSTPMPAAAVGQPETAASATPSASGVVSPAAAGGVGSPAAAGGVGSPAAAGGVVSKEDLRRQKSSPSCGGSPAITTWTSV